MKSWLILHVLLFYLASSLLDASPRSFKFSDRTVHYVGESSQVSQPGMRERSGTETSTCSLKKRSQQNFKASYDGSDALAKREPSPVVQEFCGVILPGDSRSRQFTLPIGTWQLQCRWLIQPLPDCTRTSFSNHDTQASS